MLNNDGGLAQRANSSGGSFFRGFLLPPTVAAQSESTRPEQKPSAGIR
jgi:hypothetical protein